MGPLRVLKATPCLPLPPSFLPHAFCRTLFTPPKPILGHLMNPRCLGEATEVAVHSRRCFTPLPWQCPQAFASQGSGGRKGGGKRRITKWYMSLVLNIVIIRGVVSREEDPTWSWREVATVGKRSGMGSHGLGWCLGKGLRQPGREEEAVCPELGMMGDSPGSCHLLSILHWSRRSGAQEEAGRAPLESEKGEQTLAWVSPV